MDSMFEPAPGGRIVVKLDEVATRTIIDCWRGSKDTASLFVLLIQEGSLRTAGPHLYPDWVTALRVASEEALVIYNARSKKACRVVWHHPPPLRTPKNFQIEPVRLVPHAETLKNNPPRNANARLFVFDEFHKD